MHGIPAIYGLLWAMTQLITFWDMGLTCSLIQISIMEALYYPGESVQIMIMTINRPVTCKTKLYVMELINCYSDPTVVNVFSVEKI